jgi:putative ABC transport system permease protein
MFRNYLVTALRNLARNWLYGAISILGLAVAFAAALLIAQYVRNEFSYDHWVPGYQQVYKITGALSQPGQPSLSSEDTQAVLAAQLRAVFPGAQEITRLMEDFPPVRHTPRDTAADERTIAWADPNLFKVFPLPVLAGNLDTALDQPDTAVITHAMARKYFGRDLPVGDTLQLQAGVPPRPGSPPQPPGTPAPWHTVRITPVLKDLPSNTDLNTEIYVSGRSAYSGLAIQDARPVAQGLGNVSTFTFARLKPGVTQAALQDALNRAGQPENQLFSRLTPGSSWTFHAVPLAEAHFTPSSLTAVNVKPTGSRAIAYGISGVGALIVLVAAINFVTLMTARAARRGVEVGIRKATGAQRGDLMVQFVGEALIQVAVAALLAILLAELLLPAFDAFIQRSLSLNFLADPALLGGVAAVALVVGLVAAIYPAVVLSSFRPALVLKGGVVQASGSPLARSSLVVIQFAILVGLIVTTATVYRQTQFALARGLGNVDSKLIVGIITPCNNAFPDEVRKLPGVAAAACSSINALNTPNAKNIVPVQVSASRKVNFDVAPVDFGFLETYTVKPIAGRLFSRQYGQDNVMANPQNTGAPTVIINETAARNLGFSDPKMAVGHQMRWPVPPPAPPGAPPPNLNPPPASASEIIGVVPDVPKTVRAAADPTFYFVWPMVDNALTIRMTGQDLPGTVKAIAATWKRVMGERRLQEQSLSAFRLTLYLDLIIQGLTVGVCSALAVLIACLGLFALSAYTTERRTKEIGVRKAMGADTRQVVLLLLWQFTIPVLVAIAIAVPLGFFAMNWWLHGFIYHVTLSAGTFVLAAVAGVVIAWATVSYQSFMVARAKPAGALRYE